MAFAGGVAGILEAYSPAGVNAFAAAHLGGPDTGALIVTMLLVGLFLTFGFSFVSHRFEHQADWFAATHMGKVLAARPESLPIPAAALAEVPDPSEFDASIVDARPAAPPVLTVQQYVAGEYPHARPDGIAGAVPAKASPPVLKAPPLQSALPPEIAGTEVFISSLDTLMEITHRSREKRGWMHPSVNHRVQLLRTLATDPVAVKEFRRRMLLTRVIIGIVILLGILGAFVAWRLPSPPVPGNAPGGPTFQAPGNGATQEPQYNVGIWQKTAGHVRRV